VLAREAIRHFGLERLIVVVTGTPPHKGVATDGEIRYRLAEAAFVGLDRCELSRFELDRPGPSYTLDTVRWAAGMFGDVVFVVGADEFASFLSWHDPDGVVEAARLGVATRPGYPRDRLEAVLAHLRRSDRVELFEIPAVAVSSTDVRARIASGKSVDELVPPGVALLLAELGLYQYPAASSSSVDG